ncbi:hypothetical protein [Rhizobium sp.]
MRIFSIIVAALLAGAVPARGIAFHNAKLENQVETLFTGDRDFGEIKPNVTPQFIPAK